MTVTEPTSATDTSERTGQGVTTTGPGVGLPMLGRREVTDAARVAVSFLPDRKRLLYYGALGVLAVAEIVEWPVAVAIGVGTEVARRTAGPTSGAGPAGGRPLAQPPAESAALGGTAQASAGGTASPDAATSSSEDEEQTDAADKPAGRKRTTAPR